MFYHVKELQFNARVSKPDPRFARLLLEQFGGGNGELKAAMQYFVQAFSCKNPYPDKYDLLMDVATEEFSHLDRKSTRLNSSHVRISYAVFCLKKKKKTTTNKET